MKILTSSLLVLALAGATHSTLAADITGTVTLKGTPPPERKIIFDDPEGKCSALNPQITTTRHYVVGADNGLADVFVYISKGLEGKKFTPPTNAVEILQQGCNYEPYVVGAMVGQPVSFINKDPLLHNVHGTPKVDGNEEFNFAQMGQGDVNNTKFTQAITKPEVLVKINCDVHRWMFAYVGVVDNPYFAVTDKDGHFKIANVPPGKYTLTAYHLKAHGAKPGETQEITVADAPVTANFTVEVPAPK